MLKRTIALFDLCAQHWESKQNNRNLSFVLVAVFLVTLFIGVCNHFHFFEAIYLLSKIDYNDAIEFSFNFLLFFEMIGLVFSIPESIANSIAKQFQIMSLIFLRTSFEELSNISLQADFQNQIPIIGRMAVDAGAAFIIFFLTLWFYNLQKHRPITDETDKPKFVAFKKIVAMLVLIGLLASVSYDFTGYLSSGIFKPSYQRFYLILIFADMLLMLSAFRYVIHYPNIFRYSAFVLITIFIRIALLMPIYYNAIIGIGTVLFGIGVTYVHNLFLEGRLVYLTKKKTSKE